MATKRKLSGETPRPYRIWDPRTKSNLRYRYYSYGKRAHMAALIETRWAKFGTVYEVYDSRTGALMGQYKRLEKSVEFTPGRYT